MTVKYGGRIEPYNHKDTKACMSLYLFGFKTIDGCTSFYTIFEKRIDIDIAKCSTNKVIIQTEKTVEHFDTLLNQELTEFNGSVERKPRVMTKIQ